MPSHSITIGVLALQGAVDKHTQLLRLVSSLLATASPTSHTWTFLGVRAVSGLAQCDALVIPGGDSTAISLVARRGGMLESLRDFVKLR